MNKNTTLTTSLISFDRESGLAIIRIATDSDAVLMEVDFIRLVTTESGWGNGDEWENAPFEPLPESPPRTSRWDLAKQFVRAATDPGMVGSYLRATGSRRWLGPVSLPVLDHRHQCCHGTTLAGVRVSKPCPHRHETDRGVFCKECGCVEWKAADIRVVAGQEDKSKLACPDLECPKERWAAMVNKHELELQEAGHA